MKLRKRVYIASAISKGDLLHNVNQSTAAFTELAKLGFAPFCPVWSVYAKPAHRVTCPLADDGPPYLGVVCEATREGNDRMSHADWLNIDFAWVAASDAVLRLPGESVGADAEVALAVELGIPVFHSVTELQAAFGDQP